MRKEKSKTEQRREEWVREVSERERLCCSVVRGCVRLRGEVAYVVVWLTRLV